MSGKMTSIKILILVGAVLLCVPGNAHSSEKIRIVISGAGPSTALTTVLAAEFSKMHPEYEIIVPQKSIKHRGALQWVTEKGQLLGRLGRPLGPADREEFPTVTSLNFAFVKIGFAVPKSLGITQLTLAQWRGVYSGKIKNWSELGGADIPVVRLGRAPLESVNRIIQYSFPDFRHAGFDMILDRDDKMVQAIKQTSGSIGFSDLLALKKQPDLQVLDIEGFDCMLEVALVYEKANKNDSSIRLIKEFVSSSRWRDQLSADPLLAPPEAWKENLSPRMVKLIGNRILAVEKMAATPILIHEVKMHNDRNLSLEEIQVRDRKWLSGTEEEFCELLQRNPAGKYLSKMVKGNPMIYTEAFVCGEQGAVVGEYPRTSDYWQGDERKFTDCFRDGAGKRFIGKLEYDESSGSQGVQISVPVMDGEEPVGVLIVGIRDIENMEKLGVN